MNEHQFKVGETVNGIIFNRDSTLGFFLVKAQVLMLRFNDNGDPTYKVKTLGVMSSEYDAMITNGLLVRGIEVHFFSDESQLIDFINRAKQNEIREASIDLQIAKDKLDRLENVDGRRMINAFEERYNSVT